MNFTTALLRELLDPMTQRKRAAIDGLRPITEARAKHMIPWWAWTVWLAYAITVKRIQDA